MPEPASETTDQRLVVATVEGADLSVDEGPDTVTPPLERPVFVKIPARHNRKLASLPISTEKERISSRRPHR